MKEDNEDINNSINNDDDPEDDGLSDIVTSFIGGEDFFSVSKPFGILWLDENMEKFLKFRGYKILNKHDKETDCDYKVAVKPGDSYIPDEGYSNIREMFDIEVQDVLLSWLMKNGK